MADPSDDLRKLALAARPGPWTVSGDWIVAPRGVAVAQTYDVSGNALAEVFSGAHDAAYIAAAHPQAVLALLARIEQAEQDESDMAHIARATAEERDRLKAALTAAEVDVARSRDESKDGAVYFYERDHYPLSNFAAFNLDWMGLNFHTSEQAYHWEKFAGDRGAQALIWTTRSAHDAFRVAGELRDRRRADWDNVKVEVMRQILRAKADQHEYVRRKLLATGDRDLIENSWRDDYWGWGPNRDGKNMLGRLWMEVRAALSQTGAAAAGGTGAAAVSSETPRLDPNLVRIERLEEALTVADAIRDRYVAMYHGDDLPSIRAYDAARALCNAP